MVAEPIVRHFEPNNMSNKIFRAGGLAHRLPLIAVIVPFILTPAGAQEAAGRQDTPRPRVVADSPLDAGRYLVVVGGCNDCHTDGYADSGGKIPETEWLTGSAMGWRGPWGTTYPSNLRLLVQSLSEEAWVDVLLYRNARPPMPWMSTNHLSREDASAMYRYIRSLGPKGELAPTAVAADVEPSTPYLLMVPQHLDRMRSAVSEPARQ